MKLGGLNYNVTHYFSKRVKRELAELWASVAIMDFSVAAITIFEPIYLYTIGFSLQQVMLFYLAVYVLYFLLVPLGGKFIGQIGYEHTIFYSTIFLICYYLSLFLIPHHPVFILLAVYMFAMQKSLYWPAYHGDFAQYSDSEDVGRETASLQTISMIVYVLGPLAGGFMTEYFGFGVLFFVVSILILISNIPMLITREKFKIENFSYFTTFKMIFKKENFRSFLAYLGFGEELIVMVAWPIFIYILIKDYLTIGGIIALATLVTGVVLLYIGKLTDKKDKRKMIKTGTVFYSVAWFLRLLAATGIQVFFIDAFSRLFKNVIYVPLAALVYNKANKSDIIKAVVFFEQSLAFGKIIAALLVYLLLFYFSGLTAAFVIAGIMTLLYILL